METWHGKHRQMWWAQMAAEDIFVWFMCVIPGFIFTSSVHWWLWKCPQKPQSGSEELLRCAHLSFSRLCGYLLLSSSQVLLETLFLSNVDGNRANTLLLSWAVRIALNLCIWNLNQVFLFRINSVLKSPLLEATCFKYISSLFYFMGYTLQNKYSLRNYRKAKSNTLYLYLTVFTLKGPK